MDSRSSSSYVDSNGNIDDTKIVKGTIVNDDTKIVKPELESATTNEIKTLDTNISAKTDTSADDAENNNETPIKIVSDVDKLGMALERATLDPTSKVLGSPRSITEIMTMMVLFFPRLFFSGLGPSTQTRAPKFYVMGRFH